jgi:hypothetical protein
MQVNFEHWAAETGRSPRELLEEAFAGYFEEPARTGIARQPLR